MDLDTAAALAAASISQGSGAALAGLLMSFFSSS